MKKKMNRTEVDNLKRGDWIYMNYGRVAQPFYVLRNMGEVIVLGKQNWLVSSSIVLKKQDLLTNIYSPLYVGHTKQRWWWRFSPWREIVCPFKPLLKG